MSIAPGSDSLEWSMQIYKQQREFIYSSLWNNIPGFCTQFMFFFKFVVVAVLWWMQQNLAQYNLVCTLWYGL